MGDIVLTTFLTRILRQAFPDSLIDFILSSPYAEIYKFNKNINNLLIYDKNLSRKQIKEFKSKIIELNNGEKYDLIIDLQNNLRSHFLRNGLSYNIFKTKKYRLAKIAQVYFKKNILKEILPIPIRYLNTLTPLNIKDDGKGLELWLENDFNNNKYDLLRSKSFELNSIAIAPGAYHFTKRWLPEKFVDLIDNIGNLYKPEIKLIGGIADKPICDYIELNCKYKVQNFSNSHSIIETTKIIDACDLLITNDTGVMHLAAARQVPVIAIFGSSVQSFGFIPFRVPYRIVEKQLDCRPCSHIGRAYCPKKHFYCMKNIEPADILSAIDNLINELSS